MGLSCDYDCEFEPGMVAWNWPRNLAPLATKRARKCVSCGKRLAPGDLAAEWTRYKVPEHDIEISIYGDCGENGPRRASHYHCVDCSMIADFLHGFNYAFQPTDDMRALAREHAEEAAYGRAGCL